MAKVIRKESFVFRREYWEKMHEAFTDDKDLIKCLDNFLGCALGIYDVEEVPEQYRPLISEFLITVEADYARYLKRKKARGG